MEAMLWDIPVKTMSRRSDPASSRIAAKAHRELAATHALIVLDAVKAYPYRTSREPTDITTLERHEVSRRLADLKNQGLIHQGPQRICTVGNKQMVTWAITDGNRVTDDPQEAQHESV